MPERLLSKIDNLIGFGSPTSALDVAVQAEVLNLLVDLRREHDLTFVMVSHNLGVVGRVCERAGVMRSGEFVEMVSIEVLRRAEAAAPYSRELLESSIGAIR